MALILSKSTKTVTQLKQVFPSLEANLRGSAAFQSGTSTSSKGKPASVLLTEEFLRRTPERLENVWKRCKKLTGTLVTLKRLASVQEQRFPKLGKLQPGELCHGATSVRRHPVSKRRSGMLFVFRTVLETDVLVVEKIDGFTV